MPDIIPFRGLRYDLGHVGSLSDVICPPYDVIGPEFQDQLYKKHPANFVRLELNREEPGDNDEVNKYGEALSELAWAREQARANGESYLFRGPGIDGRMANLERQIRSFYPFPVEFNADATTILRVRMKSGAAGEVSVRAGTSEQSVSVPAGSEGAEVVLREPGLTILRAGAKTWTFVTEPYTKLTIDL